MTERSTSIEYFILALALLAIAVTAYVVIQHRRAEPHVKAGPPMTAAEENYLPDIQIINAQMSEASNILGSQVFYLDGTLVNKGPQTVREVSLRLNFTDPFGEVIERENEQPITHSARPLKPGESRKLHLVFEHLPQTWNQNPPAASATYVSFR
ncbi:MAG: DUF3426 domain-containing protein [Terriglobia bacterium]